MRGRTRDEHLDPSYRRLRWLLVGILVCRGFVYMCVIPPFEGWDEYEHVGYVVHVAETGQPPVPGQTNLPHSLLAELVKYPLPRDVVALQLGRLGAVDYQAYWGESARPTLRPGTMELYEAQHAWWYYRLVAPVFQALGGVAHLGRSVAGLRLLNLVFLAASLWVAYGAVARVARSEQEAAWAGLAIAVHPLFLINGVRVANDAFGVLLTTLAVAGCLTIDRNPRPICWLAIGVAAGLAALAKAVNFALVPFIAVAWLAWVARGRVSPRAAAFAGLAATAGFFVATQHDLRTNLARYGSPTAMQEALVNRSRGRTTGDLIHAAGRFDWKDRVRKIWLRETFVAGGWSRVPSPPLSIQAYSMVLTVGLLGYVAGVGFRRGRPGEFKSATTPILCACLCLGYTAAMGYHMVQSLVAWGKPTTCPWYACAALPWFLVLAVGGARSWPTGLLRGGLPIALAVVCLGTESLVVWGRMIPFYSGGASGLLALQRLGTLRPAALGTATLVVSEGVLCGLVLWFFVVLARTRAADLSALPAPHIGDACERPPSAGVERPSASAS